MPQTQISADGMHAWLQILRGISAVIDPLPAYGLTICYASRSFQTHADVPVVDDDLEEDDEAEIDDEEDDYEEEKPAAKKAKGAAGKAAGGKKGGQAAKGQNPSLCMCISQVCATLHSFSPVPVQGVWPVSSLPHTDYHSWHLSAAFQWVTCTK